MATTTMTMEKTSVTREEVYAFISNLCADSESVIEINGHYVTGTVETIWNEEYDVDDYEARYTIDAEDADEYDILQLLED